MRAVHSTAVEYERYWNQDNLCQTWATSVKRRKRLWNVKNFCEMWAPSWTFNDKFWNTAFSYDETIPIIIYICVHTCSVLPSFQRGHLGLETPVFNPGQTSRIVEDTPRGCCGQTAQRCWRGGSDHWRYLDTKKTRPKNPCHEYGRGWKIIQIIQKRLI